MKPKNLSRLLPLLAVFVLAVAISMTGCKKKTRKTTEEVTAPPAIEEVKPETPTTSGDDQQSQMDADRQRIQTVYYDYDQSAIRGDQRDKVKTNGEIFKKWADWSISIEGHCDERGTNEYNLALGERRATAAKQALVAEGVAAGRVSTVSYGEERPADPGHSESSWSRNRRAEFRAK
ncbi:peptidoglycan-associated lipoprotein Pal [candidate division KSB1 bacterium]|nr:peptidoglycan-associated lipoprotein Pal [candidate division KSB1 bacterium]